MAKRVKRVKRVILVDWDPSEEVLVVRDLAEVPREFDRFELYDCLRTRFNVGVSRLSDGALVGQHGAHSYLLDGEGRSISSGFHEIKPNGLGYEAYLGARSFQLVWDQKNKSWKARGLTKKNES